MKRLAIVATLIAFAAPALAADPATSSEASDPMKGWNPPKVKREKADRAEISALLKKFEAAANKGDIASAMALIDFPVLMTTDDSKGEAMSAAWTAEQYRKEMEPFFKPMPQMKVKHSPTVFLVTDSLASVTDQAKVTVGGRTLTPRSATLLIRTGGEWKIKAMTEGGWGDAMSQAAPAAGAAKKGAPEPVETTPPAR